jgi:hypothetical protein
MAKRKRKRKKRKTQKNSRRTVQTFAEALLNYRRVYKPGHLRADTAGFVGEHILIMEQTLGHPLIDGDVVHHKDFHKPNNSPGNLQDMTRKEHQQIPAMQARWLKEQGLMDQFFIWWKLNKHAVQTPEQLLEIKLVKLENQRERIDVKAKKEANQ